MTRRLSIPNSAAEGYAALRAVEAYIQQSGLPPLLVDLVKMRGSQINGCAYCLDMHSKDARAGGESEQRLYLLNAWREAPFYSERERAALAWTEALTRISKGIPADVEAEAHKHFSEKELVDLSLAIIAINGWNRLAIPFHSQAGSYQPPAAKRKP